VPIAKAAIAVDDVAFAVELRVTEVVGRKSFDRIVGVCAVAATVYEPSSFFTAVADVTVDP
jgi:hypothetical protein